jgi:signal peptidase
MPSEDGRIVRVALEAALAVFVVSMVAGQVLGQPVLLGFVTTGSMQPTLDPGDGFVAVPPAIAGDIEEGDVVTFRAREIQGGGLTTHRVVGETDRGFVTKGDANPFTDQDGGEPPVKRAQVVAVAWQSGGTVVSIPGVGVFVTGVRSVLTTVQERLAAAVGTRALLGTQGIAYLLMILSLGAYAIDLLRGDDDRERQREDSRSSGTDVRRVILVFAAAVVLAATAAMVVPAGTQEFGIVSSETGSQNPGVTEQGTNESIPYTVGNGAFVPVVAYAEPASEGIDVRPRENVVPPRSTVNATLTLSAPPETGYYRRYFVEHRYLLVLPLSTIRTLYSVHPWLPIVTIDAVLGGSLYVIGTRLVGTGRIRTRTRESPSRLRRLLSRLR